MNDTMKLAFSTGPGFYAASTNQADNCVPNGQIRFFMARIEAYDGPFRKDSNLFDISFTLLPAMAENKKDVARALVQLHSALGANLEFLKMEASK